MAQLKWKEKGITNWAQDVRSVCLSPGSSHTAQMKGDQKNKIPALEKEDHIAECMPAFVSGLVWSVCSVRFQPPSLHFSLPSHRHHCFLNMSMHDTIPLLMVQFKTCIFPTPHWNTPSHSTSWDEDMSPCGPIWVFYLYFCIQWITYTSHTQREISLLQVQVAA